MSKGKERTIFYFEETGRANTEKTLDIALAYAKAEKLKTIVVASSTGQTALKLHRMAEDAVNVICVTYNAGSRFRSEVEQFNENRDTLLQKGVSIVRGLHALSGPEKAFMEKYDTPFLPLNIVADTLRIFSQGVKVCVEIAVMAAEHGFVRPDHTVVAVGGSGHGADTALVMKPVFAANMFQAKIKALLCMPA